MHEKNKFNFYLFSLFPLLCLTPITKRCAVVLALQVCAGPYKVSRLIFFVFCFFHVCTSDILEVLRWYVYPSICIAGSNSEVNNSLYNGGKWSRTMSGYIALNAISFSVCRPHKALNVDTLHINCKVEERTSCQGRTGIRIKIQGIWMIFTTLFIMAKCT